MDANQHFNAIITLMNREVAEALQAVAPKSISSRELMQRGVVEKGVVDSAEHLAHICYYFDDKPIVSFTYPHGQPDIRQMAVNRHWKKEYEYAS